MTKTNDKIITEFIQNTWYGHGKNSGLNDYRRSTLKYIGDTLWSFNQLLAQYDRFNCQMNVEVTKLHPISINHFHKLVSKLTAVNGLKIIYH